ncbi:MAG TPA: hypothetical protein VN770_09615 [Gaiellaceae bacterium]|nr:hypothetical protein [Gaiellaceae bacterium]
MVVRAFVPFVAALATTLTPAWSYVPARLRAALAAQSGGTLYLPARTPLFYRYRSGGAVHGGILTVTFTDRVRVRQGLWRWAKKALVWQVRPLASTADCRAWGNAQKTLQMSGNKVYWSPNQAWRCVTDAHGKRHVLAAIDSSGRLPDTALGEVAASGLDVSGR